MWIKMEVKSEAFSGGCGVGEEEEEGDEIRVSIFGRMSWYPVCIFLYSCAAL